MKGIQKIISSWLAVCMVFSMLPMQVFASETEPTAEPIAAETMAEETIAESAVPTEEPTIPSETVTEPTLETVVPIEETVESRLSEEAMNADTTASGTCGENLTWTLDSEGVLTISGSGAMAAGSTWAERGLTSVIIEEGVTSISRGAFSWNQDLISVSIPSTLTHIDTDAFYVCPNLKNVYISDIAAWCNIRFVGLFSNPFYYASYIYLNGELLKDLVIPETVTKLNNYVFMGATNLETVTIPESVTYVGYDAFRRCSSLADIYYAGDEARWKYISADCGYDAEQITVHYGIPNSSGTYGENVTWFHDSATGTLTVSGTGAVPNTHYGEHTPWYYIRDSITVIAVDEGITSIGNVFLDCVKAEAVQLPSTLKEIGGSAFGRCTLLTSIDIPEGVEKIGFGAFAECSNLPRVVIPSGMTDIGEEVFRDCEKLTDVSLPEGMTGIPESFFEGCTALSTITLPQSVESIGGYAFSGCSSLQEIQLPVKLKSIGDGAFAGCSSLREIQLPEKLESIGDEIFYGCSSLTEASLPYGLITITIIPRALFYECTNLTSFTVPQNVTAIDDWAFYGCTSLTSITLPKSLSVITNSAFGNCNALTDVYYTGTEEQWTALLASLDPNYNAPLFNEELQVHCNWIAESEESVYLERVLYFCSWEEKPKTVYFGADAEISFLVTEETDTSNFGNLSGEYVVVQTKTEGDQEILLSAVMPDTRTGIVSEANNSKIIINGESYTTPKDLSAPANYLNKHVVYHVYNDKLAGIEILQEKEGYLNHWHSGGRQLRIQTNATSNDPKLYHLWYYADSTCSTFLDWSIAGGGGKTDVTVTYLVDSNRVIYQIFPQVERRENGFSAEKHGWCIPNSHEGFGYTNPYYIEPWTYFVYGESAEQLEYRVGDWEWGGNCHGLSLLAVAHYLGKINLSSYFSQSGTTLNEFGYNSVNTIRGGDIFTLYDWADDGHFNPNKAALGIIEKAQVSQYSDILRDKNVRTILDVDDISLLIDELNGAQPEPLLIHMRYNSGHHAVVTDTTIKPIAIGNGRYLVPLYDCAAPKSSKKADSLHYSYNYTQSMLYLDRNTGEWGYIYNGVLIDGMFFSSDVWKNKLFVFRVSNLEESFLDEYYSYDSGQVTITYRIGGVALGNNLEIYSIDNATGNRVQVFKITEGYPVLYVDSAEYIPYFEETENDTASEKGTICLPAGDYVIKTGGDSYVQCMYDSEIFALSSDNATEVILNSQNDSLTVKTAQDEANVSCVHASSAVDFCAGVKIKLGSEKSMSLQTDSKNKTASVSTNVSTDAITLTHVVDGEKIENTTDMIHHHENLTFMEGINATCTQFGQSSYYVCECGKTFADNIGYEEIRNIEISALGHDWSDWDTVDATCVNDGSRIRSCERSDCNETETQTIPATGEHIYDQEIADAKYLVSEATSTTPAVYRKSCKCGAAGEETFTAGELKVPEFKDVPETAYYHDPVMWAVRNKITNGVGDGTVFEPDSGCTRAHVATFLWRAAGCPTPERTDMPFTDVPADDYFSTAVIWAAENGITTGTGDGTTFEPHATCTRGQIVTFLSRYLNGVPSSDENPFEDVPDDEYYTDAVLWAVEKGITNGVGDGTAFEPNNTCTRGMIVTFLYRALHQHG